MARVPSTSTVSATAASTSGGAPASAPTADTARTPRASGSTASGAMAMADPATRRSTRRGGGTGIAVSVPTDSRIASITSGLHDRTAGQVQHPAREHQHDAVARGADRGVEPAQLVAEQPPRGRGRHHRHADLVADGDDVHRRPAPRVEQLAGAGADGGRGSLAVVPGADAV